MIIIRIFVSNSTEWEITLKILFLLGYKWADNFNTNEIHNFRNSIRYISVLTNGIICYGTKPKFYNDVDDFKFEEFLDYIEQNDIKIKNLV